MVFTERAKLLTPFPVRIITPCTQKLEARQHVTYTKRLPQHSSTRVDFQIGKLSSVTDLAKELLCWPGKVIEHETFQTWFFKNKNNLETL